MAIRSWETVGHSSLAQAEQNNRVTVGNYSLIIMNQSNNHSVQLFLDPHFNNSHHTLPSPSLIKKKIHIPTLHSHFNSSLTLRLRIPTPTHFSATPLPPSTAPLFHRQLPHFLYNPHHSHSNPISLSPSNHPTQSNFPLHIWLPGSNPCPTLYPTLTAPLPPVTLHLPSHRPPHPPAVPPWHRSCPAAPPAAGGPRCGRRPAGSPTAPAAGPPARPRRSAVGGTPAGPGRPAEAGTAGGGPTEPASWRGGAGVRHGGTKVDTRQ